MTFFLRATILLTLLAANTAAVAQQLKTRFFCSVARNDLKTGQCRYEE